MRNFIKFPAIFFFVLLILIGNVSKGQDLLRNYNLREIKVDQLTDDEILKFMQQMKSSGITQDQAEQIAIAKGMPVSELQKLKQRILFLNTNRASKPANGTNPQTIQNQNLTDTTHESDSIKILKPLIDPKIFGSELFNNASLTFEPDIRLATPLNYVLGPDDEVDISIYGLQETSFALPVSAEGSITIPNVGQINVAGITIEEATQRIRDQMKRTAYSSLQNGRSKLTVTLGKIRSIRVTIIGSNKPGNYTLSSLATRFGQS